MPQPVQEEYLEYVAALLKCAAIETVHLYHTRMVQRHLPALQPA